MRIGVYIYHCGSNIAGMMDVAEVARWAAGQPGVAIARQAARIATFPSSTPRTRRSTTRRGKRRAIGASDGGTHLESGRIDGNMHQVEEE
jgi:heterodisulfide reductase subunit A